MPLFSRIDRSDESGADCVDHRPLGPPAMIQLQIGLLSEPQGCEFPDRDWSQPGLLQHPHPGEDEERLLRRQYGMWQQRSQNGRCLDHEQ